MSQEVVYACFISSMATLVVVLLIWSIVDYVKAAKDDAEERLEDKIKMIAEHEYCKKIAYLERHGQIASFGKRVVVESSKADRCIP